MAASCPTGHRLPGNRQILNEKNIRKQKNTQMFVFSRTIFYVCNPETKNMSH